MSAIQAGSSLTSSRIPIITSGIRLSKSKTIRLAPIYSRSDICELPDRVLQLLSAGILVGSNSALSASLSYLSFPLLILSI